MRSGNDHTNTSGLSIDSEQDAEAYRIRLAGELDLAGIERVDHELRRVEASDASRIVVDLGAVEFLDSSGASLLLDAGGRAAHSGKNLRLTGSPFPQVRRVLELTGVSKLLRFEP